MGGGNQQKSATARARNQAKMDKAKSGGKSSVKDAAKTAFQCTVCKSTFASTTKQPELEAHWNSKHKKNFTIAQCFTHLA